MVYIFLDDGFEEIEALTVVDLLRRAEVNIKMISLKKELVVCGAHNISVNADDIFDNINVLDADMIVLPGGPAVQKLVKNRGLLDAIKQINNNNKYIAAICAAPMILGQLNLLENMDVVCYPTYEKYLTGANVLYDNVAISKNIITSRGVGTAINFALTLIEILESQNTSQKISQDILLNN